MKNLQAPGRTHQTGTPLRIAFVFGTRPEAVKMAVPILRAKYDGRFQPIVISTGQHREMMQPILNFFGIVPDVDLQLMKPGQSLTEFVASAMIRLREAWHVHRPDIVCIQGDTATCAAAAIAAFFEKIPLAHIEAGLRTHDLMSPFPEEYNRKTVAMTAAWNFAPTKQAELNLLNEGIGAEKIIVTGNTGIDALFSVRERLTQDPASEIRFHEKYPAVSKALREKRKIVLVTTHRRESFGEPLRETLRSLLTLSKRPDVKIFLPVHRNPIVLQAVDEVLGSDSNIELLEPLDYVPFVWMMNQATILLTDSGGVQEEAPSLGKPVLVLRDKTERQEAVDAGTALLVGTNSNMILKHASHLLDNPQGARRNGREEKSFRRRQSYRSNFGFTRR
jgi:UDP-N-acetylglucosamine 2-epimerase (non-hydrolysing)